MLPDQEKNLAERMAQQLIVIQSQWEKINKTFDKETLEYLRDLLYDIAEAAEIEMDKRA